MVLRRILVVLALAVALALPAAALMRPAVAAPEVGTRAYASLEPACKITDSRLTGLSGMAVRADGTWVLNDRGATLYRLRSDCKVAEAVDLAPELKKLGVSLFDVEDLAVGPDGWLWLSDSGGNRRPRSTVTLVGWKDADTPVKVVNLKYTSGTHDTETLMIDMIGRAVMVTKVDGTAQVYATRLPLGAGAQNLHDMGSLTLPRVPGAGTGPLSRLVTAGDVDSTGTYVVLRTYAAGWEFDAPDGDLVAALTTTRPRLVPLPATKQGEAIAYGLDGSEIFTTGEGTPVNLDRVQIVRGQ